MSLWALKAFVGEALFQWEAVWLWVSVFPSWFGVDIFCCLETELRIHTYAGRDPDVCTQFHRTKPALCSCDVWHIEMEDVGWTSSTQTLSVIPWLYIPAASCRCVHIHAYDSNIERCQRKPLSRQTAAFFQSFQVCVRLLKHEGFI